MEYVWRAWFAIPLEGRVVILTVLGAASIAMLSRMGEWGALPLPVADGVHALLVEASRLKRQAEQDEDPATALQHAAQASGLMGAARTISGSVAGLQSVAGTGIDPVALERGIGGELARAWKDLDERDFG
jgi:hypothetical protein